MKTLTKQLTEANATLLKLGGKIDANKRGKSLEQQLVEANQQIGKLRDDRDSRVARRYGDETLLVEANRNAGISNDDEDKKQTAESVGRKLGLNEAEAKIFAAGF